MKTVLITGASSGIGRALALEAARPECTLHLLGRDPNRLGEVVEAARTRGADVHVHAFDLTDDEERNTWASSLQLPSLDVLIHSAGAATLSSVAETTAEQLDLNWQVNLRAPFLLTKALLPSVLEAKGQIVFINSGAGLRTNAGWSAYAASKHGLKALADGLREEVKPQGVRVMSVYPGRTATPMQQNIRKLEGKSYEVSDYIRPEDVSRMVLSAIQLPRSADVIDLNIRTGPG